MGAVHIDAILDSDEQDIRLLETTLTHDGGPTYGPQSFFIVKNQEFVKDNPVSCLLEKGGDLKLTSSHPCATLFQPSNHIEDQ